MDLDREKTRDFQREACERALFGEWLARLLVEVKGLVEFDGIGILFQRWRTPHGQY